MSVSILLQPQAVPLYRSVRTPAAVARVAVVTADGNDKKNIPHSCSGAGDVLLEAAKKDSRFHLIVITYRFHLPFSRNSDGVKPVEALKQVAK